MGLYYFFQLPCAGEEAADNTRHPFIEISHKEFRFYTLRRAAQMYLQYYGLRDYPFRLAPDPAFLFRTESALEVFANLQYGLESGQGIVVITGHAGTGKTTVLRWAFQSLHSSALAAYIFNPLLSTQDFFELLAVGLKLPPFSSKAALLNQLGKILTERHNNGLRTVLVIDEAQLLRPDLIEEIRLLSNFETNRDKLLQIILCGQPELDLILSRPELHQLKQRVSLHCSLQPLTEDETSQYLRRRLEVAGVANQSLFSPSAIDEVFKWSQGIPRLINNICHNALLTGFSENLTTISEETIRQVARELNLIEPTASISNAKISTGDGFQLADEVLDLRFERAHGTAFFSRIRAARMA